jgi:hypothetical protein
MPPPPFSFFFSLWFLWFVLWFFLMCYICMSFFMILILIFDLFSICYAHFFNCFIFVLLFLDMSCFLCTFFFTFSPGLWFSFFAFSFRLLQKGDEQYLSLRSVSMCSYSRHTHTFAHFFVLMLIEDYIAHVWGVLGGNTLLPFVPCWNIFFVFVLFLFCVCVVLVLFWLDWFCMSSYVVLKKSLGKWNKIVGVKFLGGEMCKLNLMLVIFAFGDKICLSCSSCLTS